MGDESAGDDESEDEPPEKHPYMAMFQPSIARPFLGKSWLIFMMFFLLYYILQLGLALMCCNFYSQSNPVRLLPFSYDVVEGNVTTKKEWVPTDFDCNIKSIND